MGGLLHHICSKDFQRKIKPARALRIDLEVLSFSLQKGASAATVARFGYNLGLFVVLAVITRGLRFYLEAFLLNRYGPKARAIIEERLGFWFTVSVGVFLVGIVAAVYLF